MVCAVIKVDEGGNAGAQAYLQFQTQVIGVQSQCKGVRYSLSGKIERCVSSCQLCIASFIHFSWHGRQRQKI